MTVIDVLQERISKYEVEDHQDVSENIVHHLDERIIQLLKKDNGSHARIIIHTSRGMTVTTDKGEFEAFKEREQQYKRLDTICSVFFRKKTKDKDRQAFLDFLDLFAVPSRSQSDMLSCYNVLNELKTYDEESTQHNKVLYRNFMNEEVDKTTILGVMKQLHECFTVFRQLAKMPSAQIKKLISPAKVLYFAVLTWKMMKWKVYNFWHDYYFYLFSKWESNPDRFEEMYEIISPPHEVTYTGDEGAPIQNETISITNRDLYIESPEERNEASWHS
ncbi:hypothetical protein [Rossellomorea vietnamensis]|uniref:hypothetical protein n=1 Tax=Rossellomorea vietnamensis TaxID=218284 RepID=UPI0030918664|nr:hypothetical protein Q7C14_09040 [Rossellomorea vietnamensis]WQI97517.1 hypothetical protein Q7C14_09110 [Rossellomorea vietnamensis]